MPSDALLASPDREERYSNVYARAVAAAAGYTTTERDLDRDGIDIHIDAGGEMRPALDIQLKATINLGEAQSGAFSYDLKRRNYDLLRISTQVPRLLVLLALPKNEGDWLNVSPDALILKRCAYWISLSGQPETDKKSTIRVKVPESQRFDPDALKLLMEKSRRGVRL